MSNSILRSMVNLFGDILSCSSVGGIHQPTNESSATIQLFSPPNEASSGNHPSSETSDSTMSSLTDASPGQSLPEVADHVPEPDDRPVATQPQDTVPVEPSERSVSVGMGSVDDIPTSVGVSSADDSLYCAFDLIFLSLTSPKAAEEIDKALIAIDIHIRGDKAFDSRNPLDFSMPVARVLSSTCLNATFIGHNANFIPPEYSLYWLLNSPLGKAKFNLTTKNGFDCISVCHLTPMQVTSPRYLLGYFSCRRCDGKGWISNWSEANKWQRCFKCKDCCYPHRQSRRQRQRKSVVCLACSRPM